MEKDSIEVTPRAIDLIARYFKDKEKQPIRLFVKVGGCGIRSFAVALEPPTRTDAIFDIEGFQFIVNKSVLRHFKPIKVDSDGFGFRITGRGIYPPSGCGTCGYMCRDGKRCLGDCKICENVCSYRRRSLDKNSVSSD
ncbi:MAG: hypothetical protein K9J79_00325 [Desulfobacteraceae bacterium]|nr:hypothetical protein [Desulfobacteraceae bacterium]